MTLPEWADALESLAKNLALLTAACPHCDPRNLTDCVLCDQVWHQSQSLECLAEFVRRIELPDQLPTL